MKDYQFHYQILFVSEKSKWIFFSDDEKWSIDEIEPFLYLMNRLMKIFDDKPIDLGECRYRFDKDPNCFIYQWDDLFGLVVEYQEDSETAKTQLQNLLNQVNRMSE